MIKKAVCLLALLSLMVPLGQSTYAQEDKLILLETTAGDIVIELFPDDAPKHVENFLNITSAGNYDGTVFHRIIPGFMVQGGDLQTKAGELTRQVWGQGNPGYTIDAEFNDIKHNRGIVSMARSNDVNSAGSQFFIMHTDNNDLDGKYTVFGRIVTSDSFATLDKLVSEETDNVDAPIDWMNTMITKATVVDRDSISNILSLSPPARSNVGIVIDPPEEEYILGSSLGFTFDVPEGWIPREVNETVMLIGPTTSNISPTIALAAELRDGLTLAEKITFFKTIWEEAISVGDLEILSEESLEMEGNKAWRLNLAAEAPAPNIRFTQTIVEGEDKFYSLVYGANKEDYDMYMEQYELVLDSFAIGSGNGTMTDAEMETEDEMKMDDEMMMEDEMMMDDKEMMMEDKDMMMDDEMKMDDEMMMDDKEMMMDDKDMMEDEMTMDDEMMMEDEMMMDDKEMMMEDKDMMMEDKDMMMDEMMMDDKDMMMEDEMMMDDKEMMEEPMREPFTGFTDKPSVSQELVSLIKPRIADSDGNTIGEASVGQEIEIITDIRNNQRQSQTFSYITQVQDSAGVTVYLGSDTGRLLIGQTMTNSQSWTPSESGTYIVSILIWDISNPVSLSPPEVFSVTVS